MPDFKLNGIQFAKQLVIPKAQHPDALPVEKLKTPEVLRALLGMAVPAAVEFDGEFGGNAAEIEVIGATGILTTEFELGELAVAQQTPQARLGVGQTLAQCARESARGRVTITALALMR